MVWSIPFIFKAGNKAKANEVNFNFTSIKQFVDNLEEGQANNEISIARLEANKANINGDYNQRFQVADASGSFDAINKRTLQQLTANTKEVISGFVVSKFSSTIVSCTAGVCWDSTYEYMIKSDIGLQTDAQTLSKDTTYYVYVCEDSTLSACKLILDTNATTPTVPVGYNYFRKIGACTTDESGNIKDVWNLGSETKPTLGFIGGSISNPLSGNKATRNCWLRVYVDYNNANCQVYINGQNVFGYDSDDKWCSSGCGLIPVMEGQTVTFGGGWEAINWFAMI